jgi:3-oxoadipate enol-lactonase
VENVDYGTNHQTDEPAPSEPEGAAFQLRTSSASEQSVSIPLHIEVRGDGPAVLFLHGTPTTWDVMRPVADACVGKKTLLLAMPGYGASPPWTQAPSAIAIVEAIEATVLGAGVCRLKVVGFSGGAHHALRLASLGVLDVTTVVALGGIADLSADERSGMRAMAESLRHAAIPPGFATARFLSPGFAAAHPDATARVEAWVRATSAANLAWELEALAGAPELLPALASFPGRIFARTGTLDLAAPPAQAEAIARACPRGSLQMVSGCGHALLEENRAETIAAVVAALVDT